MPALPRTSTSNSSRTSVPTRRTTSRSSPSGFASCTSPSGVSLTMRQLRRTLIPSTSAIRASPPSRSTTSSSPFASVRPTRPRARWPLSGKPLHPRSPASTARRVPSTTGPSGPWSTALADRSATCVAPQRASAGVEAADERRLAVVTHRLEHGQRAVAADGEVGDRCRGCRAAATSARPRPVRSGARDGSPRRAG